MYVLRGEKRFKFFCLQSAIVSSVHILLSLVPLADFYSLNPNEQEASVKAGPSLQPGLTHEVLVSKGGIFTFYRNGVQLASVPSPRAVTDCEGDVVLMGDPSVALASVSFYARALKPNEVAEMYVGGQPLSELATGSVLPQVEIQSEDQIIQTVCACNQSNAFSLSSMLRLLCSLSTRFALLEIALMVRTDQTLSVCRFARQPPAPKR
jgi:hypothetical protein